MTDDPTPTAAPDAEARERIGNLLYGMWGPQMKSSDVANAVIDHLLVAGWTPPAAKPITALAKAEDIRPGERRTYPASSLPVAPPPSGDRPADVGSAEEADRKYGERVEADLRQAAATVPLQFPNYADWAIHLPAGHWRHLAAARSTLSPKGEEALREAIEIGHLELSLAPEDGSRDVFGVPGHTFSFGHLRALLAALPTPVAKPDEVGL